VRRELAAFSLAAVRRGRVDNWDLVDSSAPTLLGGYLLDRPRDVLFELAGSEAERLLDDRADLMQKAVGWMLREVGKRVGRDVLTGFLHAHAVALGRTALSYATEHLPAEERARYPAMR
jgi:3-methyladenine DNA glycosylase AlkD